ncbi:hypothetical protein [Malonomonas rubra]|uniref:hypothetical protein n=1 Tax=Malonomonas rubra TaxID=57040 RepID=UPI0026EED38E|nr:hypothetical protein [Malonomonas rubra]
MNGTEFNGMCELFNDGELIWVENQNSHDKGRVVGCEFEMIEVEVGDHREKWNRSICSEITHGFKVNYDEVKKHPHEYDTHLD